MICGFPGDRREARVALDERLVVVADHPELPSQVHADPEPEAELVAALATRAGLVPPLGELPERVAELNTADDIVVHCRSGVRSADAVEFLKQAGFKKVKNLVGGINAWADEVDESLAKY